MSTISTAQAILDGFDFSYLLSLVQGLIPAVICITLHELSHGLAAYRLGDNTAKERGRLTLNPLKHIDVVGFIMMVVFHFGWAKPVPVNMYNFKNPKRGMAITALAGPASNLVITVVFLLLYGAAYIPLYGSGAGRYVLDTLMLTAYCSLGLGLFNMIPVPPLDGAKVLAAVIPDESYYKLMRYEKYGMILLVILVWTGLLGDPVSSAVSFVFDRLSVIAQWSCDAVFYLFYQ